MKQGVCLIDAQNIFYTPRKKFKARVDFLKLKTLIAAGREMRFIIYVVADAVVDQEGFLQMLMRHGYEPRIKVMYRIDGARRTQTGTMRSSGMRKNLSIRSMFCP